MKIAMISYTTDLAGLGGGGMHVSQLARALAKRGNEVTIITAFDRDLHFSDQWPNGKTLDYETSIALQGHDADVVAWKMSDHPPTCSHDEHGVRFLQVNAPTSDVSELWKRMLRQFSDSNIQECQFDQKDEKTIEWLTRHIWGEWVNKVLSEEDFDVCHAHHWRSTAFLEQGARKIRGELFFTPHLLDSTIRNWCSYDIKQVMHILRSKALPGEKEQYWDRFSEYWDRHAEDFANIQTALSSARHVIAVSEEERKTIEQFFLLRSFFDPSRWVRYVPNGINSESLREDSRPKVLDGGFERIIKFLTIGRLDPIKRFELAIKIVARLRALRVRVALKILALGRNLAYQKLLEEELQSNGLFDFAEIEILDSALPSEVILKRLRAADFYLQTSTYESFGMTVLEAMAMGTPVLVSDVGGMGDLIREVGGGIAILSDEPDVFAGHVFALIENPRLYAIFSENGVNGSKKFTWDAIAQETELFYKNAIDGILDHELFEKRRAKLMKDKEDAQRRG